MARNEAVKTEDQVDEATVDESVEAEVLQDDKSTNALATIQNDMVLGAVQGDVGMSDIRLPRLQIAYGVGKLSEDFNPGDLVLGEDNCLVTKGEGLRVVILSATQYWKEYLKQYTPGIMPRIFQTEEEVHANGGTTRWKDGIGPEFNRALSMRLLIEQPEGVVCGLFGISVGDRTFAPAVWDVDKSAYRRVGPVVLTAAQFSLRAKGLLHGIFEVSTKSEKINDNATVVPALKLVGYNTDEEIKAITALFSESKPSTEG